MKMDKIKEPTMMLASASLLCTLGSSYYFYKQLETLRIAIELLSGRVGKLEGEIKTMKKIDGETKQGVETSLKKIKKLMDVIENLPTADEFNELNIDIDEIVNTLAEAKVAHIERSGRRIKSGDRKYKDGYVDRGFATREGEYYQSKTNKSKSKKYASSDEDTDDAELLGAVRSHSKR